MASFQSKFASDIQEMRKWRKTLGYAEESYDRQLAPFDRYCREVFPDADILTWDIALSYLQTKRERCDIYVDVAAIRNLGRYQILLGKNACVFPADYFSYKKRHLPYIMNTQECQRFFQASDRYPHNPASPLIEYTAAVIFRLQYSTGMRPQEVRRLRRQDFDFIHDMVYIADSKRHKDRRIAVDHRIMEIATIMMALHERYILVRRYSSQTETEMNTVPRVSARSSINVGRWPGILKFPDATVLLTSSDITLLRRH